MNCHECDAVLRIPKDAISGEIVSCKDCGVEYEVEFNKRQIVLKAAARVEEDWGE